MLINSVGQTGYSSAELLDALRRNPQSIQWDQLLLTDPEQYNWAILDTQEDYALAGTWTDVPLDLHWHQQRQQQWFTPEPWDQLDVQQLLIHSCADAAELQRMQLELHEFEQRGLVPLLRYLNYLVHTLREHQLVLGVGRGSSVASFALYKLGVHRINSLQWQLDFTEFFKPQEEQTNAQSSDNCQWQPD